MENLNHQNGEKIASAIDKRIINVAKQVYDNSPNDKMLYGTVVSKNEGIFSVKINNNIYSNVKALRNVGIIKIGEVVHCLVPNNNYSNMVIIGVADGTIDSGGGSGDATWGFITGTLSNQTDLQTALNSKANLTGATFTGNVNIGNVGIDANGSLSGTTATLSALTPLLFTGYGTGTYNKGALVCNTTDKFGVECPRETDSPSGTIVPFRVGVRGGQLGILQAGDIYSNNAKVATMNNIPQIPTWTQTNVTLISTGSQDWTTIDLSNYLPSTSGTEEYEILLTVRLYNTSGSTSVESTNLLYSDLIGSQSDCMYMAGNSSQVTSRQYFAYGTGILPTRRYIYYKAMSLDGCVLKMLGYRRLK